MNVTTGPDLGPDLKWSAALSLLVHLALFTLASTILSKTAVHHTAPLYSVTLVADDIGEAGDEETLQPEASVVSTEKASAKGEKAELNRYLSSKIGEIKTRGDKRYISERLSALRAKANVKNTPAARNNQLTAAGRHPTAAVSDDYYRRVRERIWQEWVYPGKKGAMGPSSAILEAVISITILKDGTIRLNRIEKSSGNPNFDRCALKAINRASPLAPPREEVEIGLRFSQ